MRVVKEDLVKDLPSPGEGQHSQDAEGLGLICLTEKANTGSA